MLSAESARRRHPRGLSDWDLRKVDVGWAAFDQGHIADLAMQSMAGKVSFSMVLMVDERKHNDTVGSRVGLQ